MRDEGMSREFEERACARSSRRTPGPMQRAGRIRFRTAGIILPLSAFILGCAFAANAAIAQLYPVKPVRVVVAFAAGGLADGVARMTGQKLSERLGQPVVIDNRGG